MKRLALALAALVLATGPRLVAQGKGSESVVKATATVSKSGEGTILKLRFAVEKGWHIYANPPGNEDLKPVATTVKLLGGANGEIAYPAGKLVIDPVVGNYRVYEDAEEIRVKLAAPGPVKVQVSFQACNEKSCLQPSKVTLEAK